MTKLKVGSDYSGVGAFLQALKRLGIDYEEQFACDYDEYARQSYIQNYGTEKDIELVMSKQHSVISKKIAKLIEYGKVFEPEHSEFLKEADAFAKQFSFYYPWNVYNREIPKDSFDIYMTSPPCQGFSMAGLRKGSILFMNSLEYIRVNKPRYFDFENVKGLLSHDKKNKDAIYGRTFQEWINYLGGKSVNGVPTLFPAEGSVPYHIYFKVINAKKYGVPQNRERIFIVGIRDDVDNHFHWPKSFPLKKRLKDVLETEVNEKYFLSDVALEGLFNHSERHKEAGNGFGANISDENEISHTIKSPYYKDGSDQLIELNQVGSLYPDNSDAGRIVDPSGISCTIKAEGGGMGAKTGLYAIDEIEAGRIIGRNPQNPKSRAIGLPTEQTIEVNEDCTIVNTLTTVQKDNVFILGYTRDEKGKVTSRHKKDIANTIHTSIGGGGNTDQFAISSKRIRRLTPRECFRLMDFPEDFKITVSDTQAYRQAGNSIVVEPLALIIAKLLKIPYHGKPN